MQSSSEEFIAELQAYDNQKQKPRSFGLYEEYSRCDITETVRTRRGDYEEADEENRRKLEMGVEVEVESFSIWLEETKSMDSATAHNLAVSLKSLLLGLPIGVKVAVLFGMILDRHSGSSL